MANRKRTNPVQFYLDDEEQYILDEKFRLSGMKINNTRNIYKEDMDEVKELINEVWRTQKSMLSKQPLIKR